MKKYICFLLSAILLFAVTAKAQSTSPRFGTLKNQDNTGRVLNYGYFSFTDVAGLDSVAVSPRHYQTFYRVILLDSFCFKQPIITNCFAGDQMTIICSAASGTPFLKFSGSNWLTQGKAAVSTNLRAVLTLVFDGSKWVEQSRVLQ